MTKSNPRTPIKYKEKELATLDIIIISILLILNCESY